MLLAKGRRQEDRGGKNLQETGHDSDWQQLGIGCFHA